MLIACAAWGCAAPLCRRVSPTAGPDSQVENAINPHQHMVVRNELPQRPSDEQLQLISLLVPKHAAPPPIANFFLVSFL